MKPPAGLGSPTLPLVSVVVIHHNYGRFLEEAVGSVAAQTYPNVECIVVDDASTDGSEAALARVAASGRARVVRRLVNGGQTATAQDGFAASRGSFVIFLDADDVLLDTAVETHIATYHSLRIHPAFTSGDMLQAVGRDIVTASGWEQARFIRRRRWRRAPAIVRDVALKIDLAEFGRAPAGDTVATWPPPGFAAAIAPKLHYVPPGATAWVWSPMSGLCYRRDAVKLMFDNPDLGRLRTGTDYYLNIGLSALSGSVIVDQPVFAYRIHGDNIFTQSAQLDATLAFMPKGAGDNNDLAVLMIIDQYTAHPERFAAIWWLRFIVTLLRLDRADPGAASAWARRSRAAQGIAAHYAGFRRHFGSTGARLLFMLFARTLKNPEKLAAGRRA